MGKFRDIHQIVDNSGHNGSCLVLVKKGKRQLLKALEHVAAHVRLHPYSDDMAVILDKVIKPRFGAVNCQQCPAPNQQKPEVFVGDIVVYHIFGDDRVKKIGHRH